MQLVLAPEEVASFDGRHHLATVRGPLSLFRLCGRTAAGKANCGYGRFWFNERFFWKTLDWISDHATNTALLNHYLRYVLREFTGVCHDWNTFASIYQLSIPPQRSMTAAVGRIAPKPFFSAEDPVGRGSLPHELLVGGEFQYIVDIDATLRQFVRGPRPLSVSVGHA